MKEKKEKTLAIALDGVLRDIRVSFEKFYLKTYPNRVISKPIDMYQILNSFKFEKDEDVDELADFIRAEAPMVWGRAEEVTKGGVELLNSLLPKFKEKGYKVVLVSKESQKTKGGTLFWLGDRATEINEFRFISNNIDFWDNVDVLITANPEVLALKPKGKKAILFNSPNNEKVRYARRAHNIKDILNKI